MFLQLCGRMQIYSTSVHTCGSQQLPDTLELHVKVIISIKE